MTRRKVPCVPIKLSIAERELFNAPRFGIIYKGIIRFRVGKWLVSISHTHTLKSHSRDRYARDRYLIIETKSAWKYYVFTRASAK